MSLLYVAYVRHSEAERGKLVSQSSDVDRLAARLRATASSTAPCPDEPLQPRL